MIEHPEGLKPGDRVALTVTKVDEWNIKFGDGHFISHEWLQRNADLLPEPIPEWEREVLIEHEVARRRGPAVDVDRLREVVEELRSLADSATARMTHLRTCAATIESCLPPIEPPYTDPALHPGVLVQAEDGTGPVWVYLPAYAKDLHFRPITGWLWVSRDKLPDRIRAVFVDATGQVRPISKETP